MTPFSKLLALLSKSLHTKALFFLVFTINTVPLYSQSNNHINFLSCFELTPLPYCSEYTEVEQGFIEQKYYGEEVEVPEGSFGSAIANEFVMSYLYAKQDSFWIQNIWSMDSLYSISMEKHLANGYYMGHDIILYTDSIIGLVYEFMEYDGSSRYFITMDHKLNPIAQVPIALYTKTGTYSTDDGGKGPWFTLWNVCMEKDWVLHSTDGHNNIKRSFQVHPDGKITFLK